MIMNKKWSIVFWSIVIVSLLAGLIYWQTPIVLRLGVFIGGSWNVPSASTYELIDGIIAQFEQDHPGVRVQYDAGISLNDYSSWMSDKILEGSCPDVFLLIEGDLDLYKKLGVLKNLDPLIDSDLGFREIQYYPNTLSLASDRGHQIALPMECNPDMMLVNTSLLRQEGIPIPDESWTIDDLYTICQKVSRDKDKNGVLDQFGIYGYSWEHAFDAFNVEILDSEGSFQLHQDPFKQAITYLKELKDLHHGVEPTKEDLDSGKVAFAPMSYAEFVTYNPYPWRIKRYSNFDWQCLPMPANSSNSGFSGGSFLYMGISSRTFFSDLSWDLLKAFCCDTKNQKEIVFNGLGISPFVLDESNGDVSLYYEQIGISSSLIDLIMRKKPRPNIEIDPPADLILDSKIKELIENENDIDLSLIELEKELNNE